MKATSLRNSPVASECAARDSSSRQRISQGGTSVGLGNDALVSSVHVQKVVSPVPPPATRRGLYCSGLGRIS